MALAGIDYELKAREKVGAEMVDGLPQVEGDLLALCFGFGGVGKSS
jgi:hypothetical protein